MSKPTKYNIWVCLLNWDYYQAFVWTNCDGYAHNCLGKTKTVGSFDPGDTDHYKARSTHEIIGEIKKRFRNVKLVSKNPYMFKGEL